MRAAITARWTREYESDAPEPTFLMAPVGPFVPVPTMTMGRRHVCDLDHTSQPDL
jgi:hypothetical protein